ncbi:MAG TPA: HmuY family protein [Cryomorphaceae bacterium]|nr:HmuY family protein [Cryomorphaceae bacterium]
MKKLIPAFAIMLLMASCHKDEIPIQPYDRGDLLSAKVDMGDFYVNRVFFSLAEGGIEGSMEMEEWDIAFLAEADHAILNDARLMSAWQTPYENLEAADDSAGFHVDREIEVAAEILFDPALDVLEGVYLLDLGFTALGLPKGMVWIEFKEINASAYTVAYKKYGESEITEVTIVRENASGYIYFSFRENEIVMSPPEHSWDIIFSKFTHQFNDPPIAYLVTGVLLNPSQTVAAEYSEKAFEDISATDTSRVEWSNRPDLIGYDWKTYSFDTGTYIVAIDRTWLIRTAEGFYFKLRFTDFYDENGNAGFPSFEYRLL